MLHQDTIDYEGDWLADDMGLGKVSIFRNVNRYTLYRALADIMQPLDI